MRIKFKTRFTTRLAPAAFAYVACRSITVSAPMKALFTKANVYARARIRSAGTDCGKKPDHRPASGWASTTTPTDSGQPSINSALKNIATASRSRSSELRWYTASTGSTTPSIVIGTKSNASKGLYANEYQPTSALLLKSLSRGTSSFQYRVVRTKVTAKGKPIQNHCLSSAGSKRQRNRAIFSRRNRTEKKTQSKAYIAT